jgi:predicted phage baseplate assembly protein
MTQLAPNLFTLRFDDLVAAGRARLPSLAPTWTDYNVHDPGITLMELAAWVAEAQLYSLARMRRDERVSYAALLGVVPSGAVPARGLIWPDRNDPNAPIRTFHRSIIIADDAAVRTASGQSPVFHPTHKILWVPGSWRSLRTQLADGRIIDQTAANVRGDRAFEPFGTGAGPRDLLLADFTVNGDAGLFPAAPAEADGALLAVGVRVDSGASASDITEAVPEGAPSPLSVTLISGGRRTPLPVAADSSRGFLRTGIVLLDVSGVDDSPARFTLEFHAPAGFARPPRLLRIELNVLPIEQGGMIVQEEHPARGVPDEEIALEVSGLRFGPGVASVLVEIAQGSNETAWNATDDLASVGPADRVYRLDAAAGTVTFGNGVNGRIPDGGAQVLLTYPVCDGARGNTAPGQRWTVRAIEGIFGANLDPIAGGQDAPKDEDRRRESRLRARQTQTLVTAADIEAAALALPDLEVARAHVLPEDAHTSAPSETTLIVLRARVLADDPSARPETARWLAAIRRRLMPRLPMGTRLAVRAPRYVPFSITAQIVAAQKLDPSTVQQAVIRELSIRLALVSQAGEGPPRAFGASVSRRDLLAWIRSVSGVRSIRSLELRDASGAASQDILVPARGLPLLTESTIQVVRSAAGTTGATS